LTHTVYVCVLQMQKAVSDFCDTVKFGGEDVWVGARRQAQDWTWVTHVPLSGYAFYAQNHSSGRLMNSDDISYLLQFTYRITSLISS